MDAIPSAPGLRYVDRAIFVNETACGGRQLIHGTMAPWRTDLSRISQMIRKAMGTAVLIIFGVICAGLIAEGGVRIANHFFPYFYCYDAARGWGLRPNTSGYYRREGASYVKVNGDGFRGPDFARPKPPGTIRIAVLGDSYTEAIQVPYEDTFASVAARVLAQCPLLKGKRVEALNFGVDGYGTAQELVTLRPWPRCLCRIMTRSRCRRSGLGFGPWTPRRCGCWPKSG